MLASDTDVTTPVIHGPFSFATGYCGSPHGTWRYWLTDNPDLCKMYGGPGGGGVGGFDSLDAAQRHAVRWRDADDFIAEVRAGSAPHICCRLTTCWGLIAARDGDSREYATEDLLHTEVRRLAPESLILTTLPAAHAMIHGVAGTPPDKVCMALLWRGSVGLLAMANPVWGHQPYKNCIPFSPEMWRDAKREGWLADHG